MDGWEWLNDQNKENEVSGLAGIIPLWFSKNDLEVSGIHLPDTRIRYWSNLDSKSVIRL